MLWLFTEYSPSVRWASWQQIRSCRWALWWLRWRRENFRPWLLLIWVHWLTWGLCRIGALKRSLSPMHSTDFKQARSHECNHECHTSLFHSFAKMRAVVLGVMWKRKLMVEQFAAVDLATFGHLICGLHPSEIRKLSPYNLRYRLHLAKTQLTNALKKIHKYCICFSFYSFLWKSYAEIFMPVGNPSIKSHWTGKGIHFWYYWWLLIPLTYQWFPFLSKTPNSVKVFQVSM